MRKVEKRRGVGRRENMGRRRHDEEGRSGKEEVEWRKLEVTNTKGPMLVRLTLHNYSEMLSLHSQIKIH